MAASVVIDQSVQDPGTVKVVTVTGDASYPTGGYTLPGAVGPQDRVFAEAISTGTIYGVWDAVNKKLKLLTRSTNAEVANASNQSAVSIRLIIL